MNKDDPGLKVRECDSLGGVSHPSQNKGLKNPALKDGVTPVMMKFEIQEKPLTADLKKQIDEGFSRHAITATGYDEKFDPIAFLAMENNQFAGVIVVQIFWGALHVRYVYIEEEYRGAKLGTILMEKALAYGREHKCPFAFVETMSFQALGFYQKLGFKLEFSRSGYKHGTSFHYLRNDL